jgi:hypothetical protein
MSIILPKLPKVDYDAGWHRQYTADQLRARDIEVARLVLEAAAKVLTEHQIPVGNSAAGEMACEWTLDALKECRATIRALEVRHHE